MILRRLLLVLVFALPILLVVFAVLMVGFAIASATQDAGGATVLWWIAMSALMLLAVDLILLLTTLGIHALLSLTPPHETARRDRELEDR